MKDYVQEGDNKGRSKGIISGVQVYDEEENEKAQSAIDNSAVVERYYVAMMYLILSEDNKSGNVEQILQNIISTYNKASLARESEITLKQWNHLYEEEPNQFLSKIDKDSLEMEVLHSVFKKTFEYCEMNNVDDNSLLNALYPGIADTVANKYSKNPIISEAYGASKYVQTLENAMAYMLERERRAVREFYTIEENDVKDTFRQNPPMRTEAETYFNDINREHERKHKLGDKLL